MPFDMKNAIYVIFILWSVQGITQTNDINQYDEEGRRHGVWKKYYDNTRNLRYEGEFDHGQEIGTFKFYDISNSRRPSATRTYVQGNDSILVKFYSKKGQLRSEGQMIGKNKEGKWKYFKRGYRNNLFMEEPYKEDQLHGWKIIYFPNGQITERTFYQNGTKEGLQQIYADDGSLLQEYNYKHDRLHGYSKSFDGHGNMHSEGGYKQGLRDGEWKYYTNGKLDSIQTFPLKKPEMRVKNKSKK